MHTSLTLALPAGTQFIGAKNGYSITTKNDIEFTMGTNCVIVHDGEFYLAVVNGSTPLEEEYIIDLNTVSANKYPCIVALTPTFSTEIEIAAEELVINNASIKSGNMTLWKCIDNMLQATDLVVTNVTNAFGHIINGETANMWMNRISISMFTSQQYHLKLMIGEIKIRGAGGSKVNTPRWPCAFRKLFT